MPKNKVYIYYSGATDITGKKLQEALDITGGNKRPAQAKKFVIGWGCKTKDPVNFAAGTTVLNHPDKVRDNRNKFKTLTKLHGANVHVADFIKAERVVASLEDDESPIVLPLVGRTNFHQGGKGFWLCITNAQVQRAIVEGAQYFQNYMDIKDEYRLHIFNGKVINAQKKTRRDNMEQAFVAQHKEKIEAIAGKNDVELNADTMDYVLARLAKGSPFADMVVRSNIRGWKFSQQNLARLDEGLVDVATRSLEATDLQFGAVDCCILEDGTPSIIEINSGPGLKGTSLTAYIDAMTAWINDVIAPPKPAAAEVVAGGKKAGKKIQAKKAVAAVEGNAKNIMKARLDTLNNMLEVADEAEAELMSKLFAKMVAGQ